jgi:hypothetical protein
MSNTKTVTKYLEAFDFTKLFLNELGWDGLSHGIPVSVGEQTYELKPVAQKRSVQVLHYAAPAGAPLPDYALRQRMERAVTREAREHLIIFTDAAQTSQIWQWVDRRPSLPARYREVKWHKHQQSELLRQKLSAISFDIGEETSLTVVGVAQRLRGGFDREKVTKKFYTLFKEQRDALEEFVEGIPAAAGDDKRWYTAVLINRLMFIWFLQEKGFLDGDKRYLRNRLEKHEASGASQSFYRAFLCDLFFRGFATPRTPESEQQIAAEFGKVPYLNGGLFSPHELEEKYGDALEVGNAAFDVLFAFFDKWDWHLDDGLRSEAEVKRSGKLGEINPDVLGYIFEKFVNQKQMGAYYTKEDITEYIGKNSIIPALFQKVRAQQKAAFDALAWPLLQQDPDRYIYPAMLKGVEIPYPSDIEAGRDTVAPDLLARRKPWNGKTPEPWALPTEIWRETIARHDRTREVRAKLAAGEVKELGDLITYNLDIRQWAQDVIERCTDVPLLREIWAALAGRLPRKHGENYRHGLSVLDPTCGSGAFLFASLNLHKPLYDAALGTMVSLQTDAVLSGEKQHPEKWADINETIERFFADQTDRQRSYAVNKHIIVNNLYGVDLEEQATEIAKLRLFLKLVALLEPGDTIEPLPDIDFNIRHGNTLVGYATKEETEKAVRGGQQGSFDFDDAWSGIQTKLAAAGEAHKNFHREQSLKNGHVSLEDKADLSAKLKELDDELNKHLCKAYGKNPSKPKELSAWVASHKPFHWYVDFYPLMATGGFDAVIGNPPFVEYAKVRQTYVVQGVESEAAGNLWAFVLERCLKLTSIGRGVGIVLPHSIACTYRMEPIQRLVLKNFQLHLSYFSRRPGKLFDGVDQCICILLGVRVAMPAPIHHSTSYQRWFSEARDTLFDTLGYEAFDATQWYSRYRLMPKIGRAMDLTILNRLQSYPRIASVMSDAGSPFYVHRISRYFIKATNFVPYFRSDRDGEKRSDDFKLYRARSESQAAITTLGLNTALFYWFWRLLFDGYHCGKENISNFVDFSEAIVAKEQASQLLDRLMASFKAGATRKQTFYKGSGSVEYDEFKIGKSREMLEEVDAFFMKEVGFSEQEVDYLASYDAKYRMGQGVDEDDDD